MGYEAGKNRLECVGDVEESADLIEYYCDQIEQHGGFATKLGTLGPGEDNSSVMRPYGVWAVISPFNFRWRSRPGRPAARSSRATRSC